MGFGHGLVVEGGDLLDLLGKVDLGVVGLGGWNLHVVHVDYTPMQGGDASRWGDIYE